MTRRCQGYFLAVLFGALLNAAGVLLSIGYAQVPTNITSSGLGTAINGSTSVPCVGGTCTITGGNRRGRIYSIVSAFLMSRRETSRTLSTPPGSRPPIPILWFESPSPKSPTYLEQYSDEFRRGESVSDESERLDLRVHCPTQRRRIISRNNGRLHRACGWRFNADPATIS